MSPRLKSNQNSPKSPSGRTGRVPSPTTMRACATGGGPFKEGYNVLKGIDRYIPVDVYIPGCPPRPEAMLDAFMEQEDAEIVVVCDIDQKILDAARAKVGGAVQTETDFRKLIDRSDIDAVVISTPDHWHVPIAIAALDGPALATCLGLIWGIGVTGILLKTFLPGVRTGCR